MCLSDRNSDSDNDSDSNSDSDSDSDSYSDNDSNGDSDLCVPSDSVSCTASGRTGAVLVSQAQQGWPV